MTGPLTGGLEFAKVLCVKAFGPPTGGVGTFHFFSGVRERLWKSMTCFLSRVRQSHDTKYSKRLDTQKSSSAAVFSRNFFDNFFLQKPLFF